MRVLAAGEEKEFKKYRDLLREKVVFLNEYTTSVAAEHDPRGPDGPYQFVDKSVPVFIAKKWDGETLVQQLGFTTAKDQGPRQLARWIDRALDDAGPIVPPKHLRPLIKASEKATKAIDKRQLSTAVRELTKVIEGGADEKKFPEGPPRVATDAAARLDALRDDGAAALEELLDLAVDDPKKAKVGLARLLRDYRPFPDLKTSIQAALDDL